MGARYYVGVDAGGSRTRAAVFDEEGRRLGAAEAGPGNVRYEGAEAVEARLSSAVRGALEAAGAREGEVAALAAGIAGLGGGTATPAWFRRLWGFPSLATWDGATAFAGALPAGCGAVVIAGTGGVAYARAADGREARVGGWGPEVPSEWGADAIAREALAAAVEAEDGRRGPSPLTEALSSRLGLPDTGELARLDRAGLASLARVVGELAGRDPTARSILAGAASRMAGAVAVALGRVGLAGLATPVSWQGSVFLAGAPVLEPLALALAAQAPGATLVPPAGDALDGAWRLARAHAVRAR
ncbi:MAG: hypothetical protein HY722_10495 [Planctomycetes bacterium]|nr:hypothetical protein [Planctomycetota bacterium]